MVRPSQNSSPLVHEGNITLLKIEREKDEGEERKKSRRREKEWEWEKKRRERWKIVLVEFTDTWLSKPFHVIVPSPIEVCAWVVVLPPRLDHRPAVGVTLGRHGHAGDVQGVNAGPEHFGA